MKIDHRSTDYICFVKYQTRKILRIMGNENSLKLEYDHFRSLFINSLKRFKLYLENRKN